MEAVPVTINVDTLLEVERLQFAPDVPVFPVDVIVRVWATAPTTKKHSARMLNTTKRVTLKILIISILNFITSKTLELNYKMNLSLVEHIHGR
jgi:hypothetical protein